MRTRARPHPHPRPPHSQKKRPQTLTSNASGVLVGLNAPQDLSLSLSRARALCTPLYTLSRRSPRNTLVSYALRMRPTRLDRALRPLRLFAATGGVVTTSSGSTQLPHSTHCGSDQPN